MNDFIKSLLGGTNKNTNFVSALTGVQSPALKPVAQTPAKPAVTSAKTVVSGNPSAVSPAVKSPAGQAYVSSVSSTPKITNVDNVNKTYMSDGQQYSIDPSTGRYSLSSSIKQPVQGQTSQLSTPSVPTPQVQTTATQTQTPSTRDAYIQAYKSYQDAQKVSAEEKSAREAYNNFLAEQSKAVAGREGRGFGTPVELVRGEQEKLLRQTQPELARLQGDIGIAQTGREAEINAAKTGLDMQKDLLGLETEANKPVVVDGVAYQRQADGSLKALTQKEQEAFNLSEGQSRYAINPTTGQYELVASKGKTYAPSTGSGSGSTGNPQVDGWVALIQKGEASITNVPAGLRTAVANGLSGSPRFNESTLANLQIVEDVLKNPGAISGLIQTGSIPFTAGATTKNQYEQLRGILSLDSRDKLKGSGAISDFESKTLERAASSLGRNQGEADFENNLRKIRGVFKTASGMPADVKVTNQYGQVDEGQLTRDEINDAISQGFTVEYR